MGKYFSNRKSGIIGQIYPTTHLHTTIKAQFVGGSKKLIIEYLKNREKKWDPLEDSSSNTLLGNKSVMIFDHYIQFN